MKRMLLIFLASLLLFACNSKAEKAASEQNIETGLKGRSYVLASVDAKTFANDFKVPKLVFGGDGAIGGNVCNQFSGKGVFVGNVFKVPQVAATMMLCPDEQLNKLEQIFFNMLRKGISVTLEEGKLTLSGDGQIWNLSK